MQQHRHTKVTQNYQSACTWDIYSLAHLNEMLSWLQHTAPMGKEEYLEDIHARILRVTDDLRAIQRELNCAAMEAPGDPELMEALSQLPEMESLQVLKSALDQMRHFLWFYMQVMTNESDLGDQLRQSIQQKPVEDIAPSPETFLEKFRFAADAAILRYLSDGKTRKPN